MEFVGKIEYGFDLRGEEKEYAFIEVPMFVAEKLNGARLALMSIRNPDTRDIPAAGHQELKLRLFLDDKRECPTGLVQIGRAHV